MTLAGYQNTVCLNGLAGHKPTMPFDWTQIQAAGEEVMSPGAVGHVSGGAATEETMRANREAFDVWRILPRMLRGVPTERDLSTTLLGLKLSAPVLLGPYLSRLRIR